MAIEENKKATVRAVSFANMPPHLREKALKDLEAQQLQEGKSPKDFAWEQFVINQMDFDIAEKLLTQYMSERRREGYNKDVLYKELFTAFSQGSGEVKKNSKFRDYMASVIATGDNINLMQEIASYYEKNKLTENVPSLFYKIYEIYYWGQGVTVDLEKAVKYLKESLEGNNIEENRAKLREIYAKLSKEDTEKKQTEAAYERAVKEKIKCAATDYANYLMEHKQSKKAIPYFITDGEYKLAYYAINIKNFSSIQNGVKAFDDTPSTDDFKKSLQLMQNHFDDLKTILFAKEPASYSGILWRYIIFSVLYIPYHTFRLSQIAFILALLAVIGISVGLGATSGLGAEEIGIISVLLILLWGIILFCVDLWRRYKFNNAEDLYKRIVFHPQLESRKELFDTEIKKQKASSQKAAFIGGIIVTVLMGLGIQYIIGNSNKNNAEDKTVAVVDNSAAQTESKIQTQSDLDTEKDTSKKLQDVKTPPKVTMEKFDKDGYQFTYPSTAKVELKKSDSTYKQYRITLSDGVFIFVDRFKLYIKDPEDWLKDRRKKLKESSGDRADYSLEILGNNSFVLKAEYHGSSPRLSELYYKFNYKNKEDYLCDYIEISRPKNISAEMQEQIDMVKNSVRFSEK